MLDLSEKLRKGLGSGLLTLPGKDKDASDILKIQDSNIIESNWSEVLRAWDCRGDFDPKFQSSSPKFQIIFNLPLPSPSRGEGEGEGEMSAIGILGIIWLLVIGYS